MERRHKTVWFIKKVEKWRQESLGRGEDKDPLMKRSGKEQEGSELRLAGEF